MESRNSYTIVGLFFIFCILGFGGFLWWMSGNLKGVEYKDYYIVTNELPSGIRVESQVKFVGVVVGSVKKIEIMSDERIKLTLKIEEDIPIKSDSMASVEQNIISGVSAFNISRGQLDFSGKDRVIKLSESFIDKVKSGAESMGEQIYQTLNKLDNLISSENLKHLQNTLKNIDDFTSELGSSENLDNLSEFLANLNRISKDLKDVNISKTANNLNTLLFSLNSLSNSANGVVKNFNKTGLALNSRIENGEFDLKKAINPLLVEANEFLISFNKTLREVRNALNRLEDNPYEFFFKDTSGDKK